MNGYVGIEKNQIDTLAPESAKEAAPIGRAMQTLASYYREFLETDFKKVRLPKRKYSLRDPKNNRVGIRIERFSQFRALMIGKLEQQSASVTVSAGKYRADLSQGVQAGIASAIDRIETSELRSAALLVPAVLINKYKLTMDLDQANMDARNALEVGTARMVVAPLIQLLEPIFGTDDSGERQLAAYTQEIVERLLDEAAESLHLAVADVLIKDDCSLFEQIIEDFADPGRVKLVLQDYFEHFGAADLFVDLRELISSRQLQENTTIYLNIGEIQHKNNKFPLYYVPLDVEIEGGEIRIKFQGFVYVNKPACDFIAGEVSREANRVLRNPISERIFHREATETFLNVIEQTLHRILAGLECNGELNFSCPATHYAEGAGFRISNDLSISLADSADEAIVNDYELLMSGLEPDHPLVNAFQGLVESFLSKNPVSVESVVDTEWREASVPERLVFESPLPLAEEQRKLLQAVHHKDSRMIVVEGPPGCGKSHSLAALAFDMIREGKKVLILSDKKEALDVVEGKLNDVFERVRGEDGAYVNPVLRLGKDSANYAQIVKAGSVQKIKTALQSFRSAEVGFNQRFDDLRSTMVDGVSARIEAGKKVDLSEVDAYHKRESEYRRLVPTIEEFVEGDYDDLDALCRFFTLLDAHRGFLGRFLLEGDPTHKLESLQRIAPALSDVPDDLRLLVLEWPGISLARAEELRALVRDVEDMRQPIFNYLFRGKRLKQATRYATDILGSVVKSLPSKLPNLLQAADIPGRLKQVTQGRALKEDAYGALHACLVEHLEMGADEVQVVQDYLEIDHGRLRKLGFPTSVSDLLGATGDQQRKLADYAVLRELEAHIAAKFDAMPDFDYLQLKGDYEDFCAKRITKHIDERVVEFVEQKKNDARTLRDIIKSKSKFPLDKFASLSEAFPVMIAGLRDYANYVPFEQGLFDLVIIDEASQVSIAQALPAILRAHKVVLMGDRQQFSNVKASQASRALNSAYFEEVRDAFNGLEKELDSGLQTKLKNLDVTKSVMDFGEMTSQFMIMLRKHFRGYPEIISFSSEYFYGGALQVLKLRGKPIEDVLEFVFSEEPDRFEEVRNANAWEAGVILERLEQLLEQEEPPTVAVITPFREQQRFVNEKVAAHPRSAEIRDRLKLAIFTADTCQGEERDLIFYSMVATRQQDRLNYIFPPDLSATSADDAEGKLKVQRLNVAFSRGKEKLVFLCSKPLEEYKGSARQLLQHYSQVLESAKTLPSADETDAKSPMEAKVLEWLGGTAFFNRNHGALEIIPQFPIGDYLRSIDPTYSHPGYKVDFLLRLRHGAATQQVIIEYDGFEFHFDQGARVDGGNWQQFLKEEDVEREAILESYGYKMIRINRFNVGKDPVSALDERLSKAFDELASAADQNEFLKTVAAQAQSDLRGLEEGTHKRCSKCDQIKDVAQFTDLSLKTGLGRTCKGCKVSTGYGQAGRYSRRRFERGRPGV